MEDKTIVQGEQITNEQKYLSALKEFSNNYLLLLCFEGAACAAAIAVAFLYNILVGASIAIFAAASYIYFSEAQSRKKLGLDFKSIRGSITITYAAPAYSESIYIPSRLVYSSVTRIADRTFRSPKISEAKEIYIPLSIEYIGKDIFGENSSVPVICYEGTSEDWDKIKKDTDLEAAEIIFSTPIPTLPKATKKRGEDTDI